MRRLVPILVAAIVTVWGAAPAFAQADHNSPIACTYRVLRKDNYPLLVKVIRQNMTGQTGDEKAIVDRIGEASVRCQKQYGWGRKKQDISLQWFAGRVLSGDATFNLKQYGLDFARLQALVAQLDAPTRAAYLSGNVSNEQSQATLRALTAVGIDFAAIPAEERGAFAQKLSQGILGLVLQQEAEAAFNA